MSRHARIEEVSDSESDSDPMEMDPADFEPPMPSNSILQPVTPRTAATHPSLLDRAHIPAPAPDHDTTTDVERFKHYQCLYPVYFDKNRSRADGRRVGKQLAVENPLAREIVDAIGSLGLKALFEPGKIHPKDWSNPGRVKVQVKENGKPVDPKVKNKHHLYTIVSSYLRAHPTTEKSALRMRIPGMPPPDPNKPIPPPAVPRGWKMGTILPLHSPALSGGGVSEDILKEMMADMQGQGQIEAGASEGGRKKKDKEKKKGRA